MSTNWSNNQDIFFKACTTIPAVDIKETVKQANFLAIKKHDGIRTVLCATIKASCVLFFVHVTILLFLYRQGMSVTDVLDTVGRFMKLNGYVKLFNSVLG